MSAADGSRRTTRPRSGGTSPAAVAVAASFGHVLCPYCSCEIATADFAPWTTRVGLLSAECACGRTVTMAAVTLHRRSAVSRGMTADPEPDLVEEFELATARLAWVRSAGCVQLPSQREALDWHQSCCDAALAELERRSRAGQA